MATFYERFSILLEENPTLKQQDIADSTNIDKTSISKYCNGKAEPEADNLFSLSEMFDVSPSWLKGKNVPRKQKSNNLSTNQSEHVVFPVIGEIAAGYDKIAIENWDGETIPIHIDNLKGRPKEDFIVLEVKGNSMFPEFQNGDKVLIQKQNSLDYSGQVGAIMYNDDCATLKKVEYKEGEDWLKLVPINPNFETERIEGEDLEHCTVIGIPKLLIREYKQ